MVSSKDFNQPQILLHIFCRKSASCTHISAVLHALVALTSSGGSGFQLKPALPSTSLPDEEDEVMPITSYLCQWKVPKKRKESNLTMSAAVFEKHDYCKQKKRRVSLTEDFDPRPVDCRGSSASLLPALLDSIRGESLGVSLLFDPQYRQQTIPVTHKQVSQTSCGKSNRIPENSDSPLCGFQSANTALQFHALVRSCAVSL